MIRQEKCTIIPGETGQSGSIREAHVIAIDRSLACVEPLTYGTDERNVSGQLPC